MRKAVGQASLPASRRPRRLSFIFRGRKKADPQPVMPAPLPTSHSPLPALLLFFLLPLLIAGDWPRFRGPNGSGVSPESKDMPAEYGPGKNVLWKVALPAGYSSPTITADKVFITAFEKDVLYTIALDRKSGKILWRHEGPKGRPIPKRGVNTPVSPTPATDGRNVYVFFESF